LTWEEARRYVVEGLKTVPYDTEKVIDKERRTFQAIASHKELWIDTYPQQNCLEDLLRYCFGDSLRGVGVLDVGCGASGVFCHDYLRTHFDAPHVGCDAFVAQVPSGWDWESKIISATKLIDAFGKSSFDYVQSIETMEHIPEEEHEDIIQQLVAVSRKFVLLSSMGLSHHCGEGNAKLCRENPFMAYKGQPDIDLLLKYGFVVKIVKRYQIIAYRSI
jgi:hypothetical protein